MDIVPWITRRVPIDGDLIDTISSTGHANEGHLCKEVEARLCELYNARYSVVCSSGTAALYLAFRAIFSNEFVIPRFSFVAAYNAANMAGSPIRYGPKFGIDDRLLTRVSSHDDVRVNVNGRMVTGIFTGIEDSCGAFGSKNFARFSKVTCLSFSGSKIVSGGQGGAIVTDDEHVVDIIRREKNQLAGGRFNLKWNDLSAAYVIAHLRRIGELIATQKAVHAIYGNALSSSLIQFPREQGEFGSWHDCAHERMPRIIDECLRRSVQMRPFLDWFPGRAPAVLEKSVAPVVTRGAWLPAIYGARDEDLCRLERAVRTINEVVEQVEAEEAT